MMMAAPSISPSSASQQRSCGTIDSQPTDCPRNSFPYFSYFRPLKSQKMKQETDPKETPRAFAFEMWMTAPMPMVMWGKYRKEWFKTKLPVSFQFHHVQMDGGDAARFLEALQKTIGTL